MRLTFGVIFALHGVHQLLGLRRGGGMATVMERLGFHPKKLWAYVGGIGNLAGGLMLTLGALTFLGCALIISVMVVAMMTLKLQNGFWERDGGYEYNIAVIGTATALGVAGPGPVSLDAVWAPAFIQPELFFGTLFICLTVAALGLYRRLPSSH